MFNSYRRILSKPGALAFSSAGFIARYPMAMVGISIVLMISTIYGSYDIAGQVAAVSVIAYAIGAPILSKLVDRYGQARVMRPALVVSILCLFGMASVGFLAAHPAWFFGFAAVGAATSGSLGSMVRSRWARVLDTPAQLHSAFALESALDEFVYMTGPVIATFVCTAIHPAAGLIAAAVFVLGGGFWLLSQRATEPPPIATRGETRRRSAMNSWAMIVLALTYMFAGAMFGATDIAVVAFSEAHGWKGASGLLLGIYAFGSLLSALLYGARSWRIGQIRLFALGVILLAIGSSTFILADSIPALAVIMFLTGFSISPTMTNVNNIVQRVVPPAQLTEGLTWMSTAMNLGVSLGLQIAGSRVDRIGASAGFTVAIITAWMMVAVALATLPVLRNSIRRATARFNAEIALAEVASATPATHIDPGNPAATAAGAAAVATDAAGGNPDIPSEDPR